MIFGDMNKFVTVRFIRYVIQKSATPDKKTLLFSACYVMFMSSK